MAPTVASESDEVQSLVKANKPQDLAASAPATLQERLPLQLLQQLMLHPEVDAKQRFNLKRMLETADDNGMLTVRYRYAKNRTAGRLYAAASISLQSCSHRIRHTLMSNDMVDIDIVNCFPTFLEQLCRQRAWPAPLLTDYVARRNEWLLEVMQRCHVTRDHAKELFLSLTNGGRVRAWMAKHRVTRQPPAMVNDYDEELQVLRKHIWNAFPEHHEAAEQRAKENMAKGKLPNPYASCQSYVLDTMENDCLAQMRKFFETNGWVVGVLVFDGCMIYANKDRPITRLDLDNCSDAVEQAVGYRVRLEIKPMDQGYALNPFCTKLGSFAKVARIVKNQARYVSELSHVFPSSANRHLIKSPTGSGKTKYVSIKFAQLVQQYPSKCFVVLSHRCSITEQHRKDFSLLGFVHYEEDGAAESLRIITTLDSLVKFQRPIDFLYIDELESLLQHVFSSTLNAKQQHVWRLLLQTCNNAQLVICSDADFGDLSLTFFEQVLRSQATAFGIDTRASAVLLENVARGVPKTINVCQSKHQWFAVLEQTLSNPLSKIFIGCDSKAEAQMLNCKIAMLIARLDGEDIEAAKASIQLYTSEDGDRADLANAKAKWADKRVVICSPTIVSGTDYNNTAVPFTAVMGFYVNRGLTLGAEDAAQQLERCRQVTPIPGQDWHVCLYVTEAGASDTDSNKYPTDVDEIASNLVLLAQSYQHCSAGAGVSSATPSSLTYVSALGETMLRRDDPFVELYLNFLRKRNLSKNQLRSTLMYMYRLRGHTVVTVVEQPHRAISDIWHAERSLLSGLRQEEVLLFADWFDLESASILPKMEAVKAFLGSSADDSELTPQQLAKTQLVLVRAIRTMNEVLHATPTTEAIAMCHSVPLVRKLLTKEKTLKGYLQFRSLCRTSVGNHDEEHNVTFLTDSDRALLTVLDLVEREVLHAKRFEVLSWSEDALRTAARKPAKVPPQLNELITTLKRFPVGEKLKLVDLSSLYNVYKWVCHVYNFFCTTTSDGDRKQTMLQTRTIRAVPAATHKLPKKKSVSAGKQCCSNCNHVKSSGAFHQGKGECKDCRTTLAQFYIAESNKELLARYIEICGHQPSYSSSQYRINEPIVADIIDSQTKLHALWSMPPCPMADLLQEQQQSASSCEISSGCLDM